MIKQIAAAATLTAFGLSGCASMMSMGAPDISRLDIPNAQVKIAAAVAVPPGYTTYYISGAIAAVANPNAPAGSTERYGDTETQTTSVLAQLKANMAKLGLTFADVVAAHAFVAGDPALGGKMDFVGMNKAWSKEFGTPEQPNKPARAAFQVVALAAPGALVEIEFIAAKKAK
jgi:enamine deaminase RidA (YjgF/YER057c/UK114 family)